LNDAAFEDFDVERDYARLRGPVLSLLRRDGWEISDNAWDVAPRAAAAGTSRCAAAPPEQPALGCRKPVLQRLPTKIDLGDPLAAPDVEADGVPGWPR
jgi:hypothetical protein